MTDFPSSLYDPQSKLDAAGLERLTEQVESGEVEVSRAFSKLADVLLADSMRHEAHSAPVFRAKSFFDSQFRSRVALGVSFAPVGPESSRLVIEDLTSQLKSRNIDGLVTKLHVNNLEVDNSG